MIVVTRSMVDAGMKAAKFVRGQDTLIYLTRYPQHQDQIFEMIYRAMRRLEATSDPAIDTDKICPHGYTPRTCSDCSY